MTQQALTQRLPLELRQRPQWLLAGPNDRGELKVPTTVRNGQAYNASTTDHSAFMPYEDALAAAIALGYGLGYVLTAADPFTCLDVDIYNYNNRPLEPHKWTSEADIAHAVQVVHALDTYSEVSQSGYGMHCWMLGKIGAGLQRGALALYSQERFIACTGKVYLDRPIQDRQDILANMASQMQPMGGHADLGALDKDEELTDEELLRRAWNADNGPKFQALWAGEWVGLGYPSQSEADLSLMSMLTFYSHNNEQCRRIFRRSKLADREKALKNDKYLDNTLRLIRTRQAREDEAAARIAEQAAAFLAQHTSGQAQPVEAPPSHSADVPVPAPPVHQEAPPAEPPMPPVTTTAAPGLPWPPGMVGALAQFIYNSAPRPVKEVALVAALGWMAGVCGKGWIIPQSGLNLYIILVAKSAIGKEAMHTGIGALTHRIREGVPSAGNFVSFADYASGPALAKACAAQTCFVNVAGEFGRKLKRMAGDNGEGPMQSLRTVMTNLYQKSGPASIVGGVAYSNKDNDVSSISGVAYSMIGETTPGTLYAALTESMMEDGFLSRFNIVEYTGDRPPLNQNPQLVPSNELTHACQSLCLQSATLIANAQRTPVSRTAEAGYNMDRFEEETTARVNSTDDESIRQVWSRAHLKLLRIAALLAVGDDCMSPCIQQHHVDWAMAMIRSDIESMLRRLASGDVGQGDNARHRKLVSIVADFLGGKVPDSYGIPRAMWKDGVVPRKYLQMRSAQVAAFSGHPMGATRALDDEIRSLCDSGYLAEIPKEKAGETYTFQGRCFRVVSLPRF